MTAARYLTTLREMLKDIRFSIGAGIFLFLFILICLTALSPFDPNEWQVVLRDLPPSWEHLLGTNSLGQDVFWRMTFAVRNSLLFAAAAAALSRIIAVTVGLVSGYAGGIVDRVLMFITDGILVIPLFLILVLLSMLVREHMNAFNLVVLFGLVSWPWGAHLIRSEILSLREREFTYTSILSGVPTRRLVFGEYIPFILPLVFSTFINNMAWVVGMEITLAYLGLTNLLVPTLGAMINWAVTYQAMLLGLWWWLLAPIFISVATFVALYLISVGITQYLDPRARIQRIGAK